MSKLFIAVALAASAMATVPASAQIVVDGNRDAAYGTQTAKVDTDPNAPTSNFGAPTNTATVGYFVYLTSDANNVYGFLQSRDGSQPFANLYFDLDPANGNGSDLGFEINNDRAFIAGGNGDYASNLAGLNFAVNAAGTGIEFSIANSLFTGPIAGLNYGNQQFPGFGDKVTLRLSQSFGYSVAGGDSYGPDRLGSVTIGGLNAAVPEPSTWAMMIGGFGLVGGLARRSRKSVEGRAVLA